MPKNKVTLTDIATHSDVSPATVSLVLRDKPGISQETRQRVLDSAQALGYIHQAQMSQHHVGAGGNRVTTNVGLIIRTRPNDVPQTNSFYAPVLAGIESVCRQRGVNLMYATMPVDDSNNALEIPRLVREQEADGVLLVGMVVDQMLANLLNQHAIPAVLVDAYSANIANTYDAVVTDNQRGGYLATRYLIEKGHRQIALLGSEPVSYPSIRERRAGYVQAMEEAGLSPLWLNCALEPEAAEARMALALAEGDSFTAVFGCNDAVTLAAMNVAQNHQKQVPQDIAFIGFDNITLTQHVVPALTTMRIDKMGMGRLAAQLLFNRLDYPEAGFVQAILQPELFIRKSV